MLQERIYKTCIHDVAHLQERHVEEWAAFDHRINERAMQQWKVRLRASIKADGGHFEHKLLCVTSVINPQRFFSEPTEIKFR